MNSLLGQLHLILQKPKGASRDKSLLDSKKSIKYPYSDIVEDMALFSGKNWKELRNENHSAGKDTEHAKLNTIAMLKREWDYVHILMALEGFT